MEVGIINYNGGEELLRCVKSLTAQSVPVRVLVYDNASVDNSIELLQQSGEPCEIIRSEINRGYAGACNGLRKKMTSEIQVLCNMDLDFEKDWAKNLLACFDRHPEAASVASLVMERSGVVNAVGVLFDKDLFAENESSGKNAKEADIREKEVFGCYGAVMAFRKESADQVGDLDESFFLFFEESEWYFRFNLCGYKTVFCPQAKVYHERSLTTVRYSPRKLYFSERNRLRSAIRLLPVSSILRLPIFALKRYIRMAKGGVPKQSSDGKKLSKVSVCNALLKAWIEAFMSIPKEWEIRIQYEDRYGNVKRKTLEILDRYPLVRK